MKFVVSSSALYNRLEAASKVMTAKNSMPILDCFLFDIKNGKVTITASDGEKYFITSVPLVDSDNNAQFCITAKTIMDSIKELAEQPLTFGFDPESHELQGQHQTGVFSVMTFDAATYPAQQPINQQNTNLELEADILLTGINRCLFATANDEIRVVMTGIFLDKVLHGISQKVGHLGPFPGVSVNVIQIPTVRTARQFPAAAFAGKVITVGQWHGCRGGGFG